MKKNQSQPQQFKTGYIISESLVFWMCGGISAIAMLTVLVYSSINQIAAQSTVGAISGMLILQALINWPHFLGAYSLLYRSTEQITKYKNATLIVPALLLIVLSLSIIFSDQEKSGVISINQSIAYITWLIAAFYLAWHYTGQSWGLIASFSHLSNTNWSHQEKKIIYLSIKILIAWHVIWGAQDLPANWLMGLQHLLPIAQNIINTICIIYFVIGLIVWLRVFIRQGRKLDKRIFIVWLSIYLWYLTLFYIPKAYPLVQLSHALQYLIFPFRVDINKKFRNPINVAPLKKIIWGIRYFLILFGLGLFLFLSPNYISNKNEIYTFSVMIASIIAIHHYFVDSCIWKISNPEVRKKLFMHLPTQK